LDQIVQGLKFRRLDYLGPQIGAVLLDRFRPQLGGLDGVVPMPLGPWRRWRRGFNQAERIARPLARGLGLPLARPLARRDRRRQLGLTREERLGNLRTAFRVRHAIAGQRVLLVDDVATTGATLQAAAAALREAGASEIIALVAARVRGSRFFAGQE
jgi:ComF family protein